ncbi:unnamed protein product [Allacma fusca]|uniref:Uncharacterized protein n=1 Tax=Allacma fusca TaxID=39272 RepID=A0A8J2PJR3_9HEXA|nr:unnamed protein product [Allacma fusca]
MDFYVVIFNYASFHIWVSGFQGEDNIPVNKLMRQIAKSNTRHRRFGLATIPMIVLLYTIRMNFLPDRANHLTSLFRNPKSLTFLEKFPFLAIHCYIWALINYSILYAFAVVALFGRTMKEHLCVLLRQRTTENRQMRAFLKIYPQLQVLQLEFNDLWGNFLCCFLVLFVTSEILNLYQAVVLHTVRAIFIAAVMTYGLHVLITSASEHFSMSVDLLKSCKIQYISPWHQRYMRSCRPLFTTNGGFGFFDKPLLLTLWTIVIHNTVTLMVGHQHEKSKIST